MNFLAQKRIIYIGIAVLLLALVFAVVWFFIIPQTGPKRQAEETGVTGKSRLPSLPETMGPAEKKPEELKIGESAVTEEGKKLSLLADFAVMGPSLNKEETKILFYKKSGGDLFSSDFSGLNQEKISNITVVGISEIIWSPLRDRAAIFYLDRETLKSFLHIGTSSVSILPQNQTSFSWSPDGKNLAYTLRKNDESELVVADAAGKNSKIIFSFPVLDPQIGWITSDKIAMQTAPSAFAPGFIFTFSRASGVFNKIIGPLRGLASLWSPDGSLVLVSFAPGGGKNLKLALYDSGGKEAALPDFSTLPQKCAWSGGSEIYCAVPEKLSPEWKLPDDWLRGEAAFSDKIFSFDVKKKETKELFGGENFDISDIIITKKKDYLFFLNRRDGKLWSLQLK